MASKVRNFTLLFFKGIGMGSADIIPGVSGGTIAFITGIYEELINSIQSFDFKALKLLVSLDLEGFWKRVNGNFLAVLVSGIAVSVLSFASVITYLLDNFPIQIWSFFFGLIIISALSVMTQVKQKSAGVVISSVLGILIAFIITSATPATTPDSLWFIFICGMVAICAMILPGISGSFILLIFGKYEFILNALKAMDFVVILTFIGGCIIGLLSFTRIISWLFSRFHDVTVALLAGFMFGSLNKVWPWKLTTAFRINSHGEQVALIRENILPTEYFELTGTQPELLFALFLMALGFFIIVILEKIALKLKEEPND
ncbi:MAG: DUF368 domain-containing protein [Bacteroidetes bacterium]|nr:DUF368 domain-containing protein [Bacteroidota bacterium]MDA1121000.1 DUF368 domain-containing protein [Bacteroidota bacterium]